MCLLGHCLSQGEAFLIHKKEIDVAHIHFRGHNEVKDFLSYDTLLNDLFQRLNTETYQKLPLSQDSN